MKINILNNSEYFLYPDTESRFFHINIELISNSGDKESDEISVSRDKDGFFHWIKSGDLVEKIDVNSGYELSNCVLKYCYDRIR
jgi:hypothetical protein